MLAHPTSNAGARARPTRSRTSPRAWPAPSPHADGDPVAGEAVGVWE